jgi:hypothetical protein
MRRRGDWKWFSRRWQSEQRLVTWFEFQVLSFQISGLSARAPKGTGGTPVLPMREIQRGGAKLILLNSNFSTYAGQKFTKTLPFLYQFRGFQFFTRLLGEFRITFRPDGGNRRRGAAINLLQRCGNFLPLMIERNRVEKVLPNVWAIEMRLFLCHFLLEPNPGVDCPTSIQQRFQRRRAAHAAEHSRGKTMRLTNCRSPEITASTPEPVHETRRLGFRRRAWRTASGRFRGRSAHGDP